jgi:protein-disulfide isomerase
MLGPMKTRNIFIVAAAVLVAVAAGIGLMYSSDVDAQTAAGKREALLRPHAQTLGRAEAPVQLVEFLDPACETCAKFYPLVKKLAADHREDIRLVVRYAPFHPGSDQVVKALEATRRQGKYWQALEALLASQGQWVIHHRAQPDLIWAPLAAAGVDVERAKADMQSPEVARVVAQDIADANALKVPATPEFFVNGRQLPSFGYQQLRDLVSEELAKAAGGPRR